MIFVWNQRLVSRVASKWQTGLVLALCLACWRPVAAQNVSAEDLLSVTPDVQLNAREQGWFAEDRAWIQEQAQKPGIHLRLDAGAVSPDSLSPIQVALRATSAQDSLVLFRPVEARLRDRWLARGYLLAQVMVDSSAKLPRFRLSPGGQFVLQELQVLGAEFEERKRLLDLWLPQPESVFLPEQVNLGISRILEGAGQLGYPFARWVTSEVLLDTETQTVSLKATLIPGQKSVIGPVTSDLANPRAARFLMRSSGLVPGRVFRERDLEAAVQRLIARDMYTSVGIPQVYPTSSVDTVGIHFPVVPRRKINRLQIVLGLSRKQEEGPSRLSGEVDLRLPNMAGSGRNLGINWRDDGSRKSRFGFDYLEPMAFGTPLDMSLALDSEVEEDIYTRIRVDNRWQLSVVDLWGLELGLGWDRSTFPTGSLESTKRTRARGAFLHRRGDRTRSGWAATFAIESGWRSSRLREGDESALSNAQLGEAQTQRIYEVDTSGEIWLSQNWSLAGRASFRQLDGDQEVIPLSEQFRFGGAASLRGYREDEFHGSEAAWAGIELRIGPPRGSRLYTFYDLGYFGFSSSGTSTGGSGSDPSEIIWNTGWPKGYGLGILARTPGGDISLAVGFPGTVDFEVAKLHVTLLESF